jgi:hypothetical protein
MASIKLKEKDCLCVADAWSFTVRTHQSYEGIFYDLKIGSVKLRFLSHFSLKTIVDWTWKDLIFT